MATKTTGAEFKRFYADPEFWPEDAYHEDELVEINGSPMSEDQEADKIPDDAQVKIEGGIVFGDQWNGNEPSFEAYFKRWKRKQTTTSFLVECDIAQLEALKAAVKAAGGKIV